MGNYKYKQVDEMIELCIEPKLEAELKKIFNKEMIEGFRKVMDDGRIYYTFEVSDEKAFLLQYVSGILRFNNEIRYS